jgi:hypothetical protein
MRARKASSPKPAGRPLRVALQLPPDLSDDVRAYAESHCIQRSLAFRCLIEAGLAAEAQAMLLQAAPTPPSVEPGIYDLEHIRAARRPETKG